MKHYFVFISIVLISTFSSIPTTLTSSPEKPVLVGTFCMAEQRPAYIPSQHWQKPALPFVGESFTKKIGNQIYTCQHFLAHNAEGRGWKIVDHGNNNFMLILSNAKPYYFQKNPPLFVCQQGLPTRRGKRTYASPYPFQLMKYEAKNAAFGFTAFEADTTNN